MTRTTRRSVESRLDEFEAEGTGSPRKLNWYDLLLHAEHVNQQGEDADSLPEFFGGPVLVPNWVDELPNSPDTEAAPDQEGDE